MSKTVTVEEFEDARGRDIIDDAREFGELLVTDTNGAKVVVVRFNGKKSVDEAYERVRKEWDERLEVLNEPGTTEKLNEIFALSPQEIADAANRAARRKG